MRARVGRVRVLDDRERWLSWWDGRVRSLVFDLLVALLCSVGIVRGTAVPAALTICAVVATGLGLLVRRRYPGVALATGVAVLAVGAAPLPASIGLYTFARRRGPCRLLWLAGAVTVAGQVAAEIVLVQQGGHGYPVLLAIAVKGAVYCCPAMLGLWLHQRQVLMAAARERIERAERERELLAERAVADERRRVAREMHDIVAHRASVMALQAGALTVQARDERTAETAEIIRQNSAQALTELRGMLRVLRDTGGADHHGADSGGVPAVRSIETLVSDAVAAGSVVRLDMPEVLPETSEAVGRAAYRVVQEALTNASKHAPHAPVRVDVAAVDGDLAITVCNDPGRGSAAVTAGSGYGLLGMRERVALVEGDLEHGPTVSGGYRVRVVLPALDSDSHGACREVGSAASGETGHRGQPRGVGDVSDQVC